MRAKGYLKQAFDLDKEINRLIGERQAVFQTLLSAPARSADKIQVSAGNTTEKTYMKLLDYSNRIDEQIDKLVDLKIQISKLIKNVDDQKLRALLSKRYIELKRFEEIAVEMNYDIRHVYRLHGNALQVIEKENQEFFKRCH